MKFRPLLYFSMGAVLTAMLAISFSFDAPKPDEGGVKVKKNSKLQYKWYVPDVPDKMDFAGEPVPLYRWDVKEDLEWEVLINCYRHSSTMQILRLTTRFFPIIEQRLRANGVPEDFKYLCVAESSLQNVVSPAGARGYWQFMKGSAQRYGLEVNDEVDMRYNIVQATDAACAYLKEAYAKFGSWTAAAASYNCGMAGFDRYSSYQQQGNYYDLQLPEETMRYVFRILAFKYIISSSEEVGFYIQKKDEYLPLLTRKITVTNSIPNLADFAIYNGTTYKMLKTLNPWLRDHSLTISKGNSYEIELPAR